MTRSARDITVFVSSTSEDLADYRAVVRNVILDLDWRPKMMEHFGARPGETVQGCYEFVDESDLMLLVVAWRRGWVPTEEQGGNGVDSITALELARARERGIPVLAMLAGDMWPMKLTESEAEPREWIATFRDNLNQIAVFFDYEAPTAAESERLPRFRSQVKEALLAQKERLLNHDEPSDAGIVGLDFFDRARTGLVERTDIPVIGCGIHGAGPLSAGDLAKAMIAGTASAEELAQKEPSLATAAEYRERLAGPRPRFLDHFRALLEAQAAQITESPVVDMLAEIGMPPLVVSACYDQVFEQRMRAAGHPFAVVAHIVRSFDGEHDGRLLVLREGAEPEICRSDELCVDADVPVVYKPQGSPYLHDGLDPDLELDTVVVTETDHVTFLRRLESAATGIPGRLSRQFRRSALLFLGYPMDVWQYRLMMQVFEASGRQRRRASTLSVRIPGTPIEEVAWRRLDTDLIRMDPADFARRVLEAIPGR